MRTMACSIAGGCSGRASRCPFSTCSTLACMDLALEKQWSARHVHGVAAAADKESLGLLLACSIKDDGTRLSALMGRYRPSGAVFPSARSTWCDPFIHLDSLLHKNAPPRRCRGA